MIRETRFLEALDRRLLFAGPGDRLDFESPLLAGAVAGGVISVPRVLVRDVAGDVVSDAVFTPTLSGLFVSDPPGPAVFSGTPGTLAAGGAVTFTNVVLERAGRYTLIAEAPGLKTAFSTTFEVLPAEPVTLTLSSAPATSLVAGTSPGTVQAVLSDRFGNIATNATTPVRFSLSGLDPIDVVPVGGIATLELPQLTVARSYGFAATWEGLSASGPTELIVSPAPSSRLVFSTTTLGVASKARSQTFSVRSFDSFGNPTTDRDGTPVILATTTRGVRLEGTTIEPLSGGVAVFSNLRVSGRGEFPVTAAAGPVVAPDPMLVTSVLPNPESVAFSGDTIETVAGRPVEEVTATAIQFGIPLDVRGISVSLRIIDPAKPKVVQSRVNGRIDSAGILSFRRVVSPKAGTFRAVAVRDGRELGAATFIVSAAPPEYVTVTAPRRPVARASTFSVSVSVFDSFGNKTGDADNPATLKLFDSRRGQVLTLTAPVIDGVATFSSLSPSIPGTYVVDVSVAVSRTDTGDPPIRPRKTSRLVVSDRAIM